MKRSGMKRGWRGLLCAGLAVAALTFSGDAMSARSSQNPPFGAQPDGTFIGPDGVRYVSQQTFVESGGRCGTKDSDSATEAQIKADTDGGPVPVTGGTINVYCHVIRRGSGTGNVPPAQINAQIDVLNRAFSSTGFRFVLAGSDYTDNDAWFEAGPGTSAEAAMKQALRQGTADDLNIYTNSGAGLLGWASSPWEYAANPQNDGAVIFYATLPGGFAAPYNQGHTAAHELGHALGFQHEHTRPAFGCPVGSGPVHNFMALTDDACMFQFTSEQAARMALLWATYRAGK